jgi:hypothetical protein
VTSFSHEELARMRAQIALDQAGAQVSEATAELLRQIGAAVPELTADQLDQVLDAWTKRVEQELPSGHVTQPIDYAKGWADAIREQAP